MPLLEQVANLFRIRDLRHRILVTVGLIAVARIGCYIPVPGINVAKLGELLEGAGKEGVAGVLNIVNMFAGGALGRGAIFGLGVMPYISASIIFQLLANVIPSLERLRKEEGEAGLKKLNQYTRIATVFICMFQGALVVRGLFVFGVVPDHVAQSGWLSLWFSLFNGFLLMSGTMLLMWLGEQIDEHGIGNGISLIIMVNILDRLPVAIWGLARSIADAESQQNAVLKIILLLALFVAVVVAIIYITRGERRIPVQHAKHVRGPKVYGGQRLYLPLKVNMAGVMPLIFASALLQFPSMIAMSVSGALSGNKDSLWYAFFTKVSDSLSPTGGTLPLTYVLLNGMLIFFFCYFWTAMQFNPKDVSENLKDNGSFIPGIRPGRRTADYLESIVNRVTLAGSFFLIVIALMPMFVASALKVDFTVAGFYGGTSILIVVGVALDLVKRINDHLEMRRYEGFAAGGTSRRKARRRR